MPTRVKFRISGVCFSFESPEITEQIKSELFGTPPMQFGYCCGRNSMLGATDWHTSTEVNIAATDLVLLLVHVFEIENWKISSARFKAFFVPRATVIEVYQTSLHFCPCEVSDGGFACVVALPLGINTPLEERPTDTKIFRKTSGLSRMRITPPLSKEAFYPAFMERIAK